MKVMEYRIAASQWPMDAELGNNRIIAEAPEGKYIRVKMPWRRRDMHPECIGMKVRFTPTGKEAEKNFGTDEVTNIRIEKAEREEGIIVFEAPVAGKYEIYYYPGKVGGWVYSPDAVYDKVEDMKADEAWLAGMTEDQVKEGEVLFYEARTEHDSYYPMEVPMTAEELASFTADDVPFKVIMESRLRSIRMKYEMPYIWTERSAEDLLTLTDTAYANEHYVFQVGVYGIKEVKDIRVDFYDAAGNKLDTDKCICFNLSGVNTDGIPFEIHRDIAEKEVLPLWCGIPVEKWENAAGSELKVTAVISAANTDYTVKSEIILNVENDTIPRNGDNDLWRMARLFWLNSDLGISDQVLKPFTPIENGEEDLSMGLIGKQIIPGSLGLPEKIVSYYNDECLIGEKGRNVLNGGFSLNIEKTGAVVNNDAESPAEREIRGTNTTVIKTEAIRSDIRISSDIKYEADGHVDCKLYLEAAEDGEYAFNLQMFVDAKMAEYMVGMCYEGGKTPGWWTYDWKHTEVFGENVWLGSVRGGIQIKLLPANEQWSTFGSAHILPPMWYNEGMGSMSMKKLPDEDKVLVESKTGRMHLKAGQKELLHFHLLLTPFHPIDYKYHWTERMSCGGTRAHTQGIDKFDWAVEHGGTLVYLHHGSKFNWNINYPFLEPEGLKGDVDDAHERGLTYKIYYTVRELSNYATELWALRSFGDEILNMDTNTEVVADYWMPAEEKACRKGMCFNPNWWRGGLWLVEHMYEGYVGQWHQPLPDGNVDCAVHMNGDSRWHNYYVEGMKWLIEEIGIDGLYLDGIGYDRRIMKRLRRVMEDSGKRCDIDIHSGNDHQVVSYGYISPANRYLEHFVYADSLWLGEGYAYETMSYDYQLIENSAIPFGVMSEMLQGGGNPYRGMVFGETARLGTQPVVYEILKVQREFDMTDTRMLGFWNPECPVVAENDRIKATAFVKEDGRALVAMANWYPDKRSSMVTVNKEQLGIEGDYEFYAPAIEGFQEETVFSSMDMIPFEKNKGWIFLLRRK
ncbi:MAG: hypothetical protein E7658_06680 [Ruminococcaceae bacterium]|nr:hypothetical protein [Oscillospiraceae bacterium]